MKTRLSLAGYLVRTLGGSHLLSLKLRTSSLLRAATLVFLVLILLAGLARGLGGNRFASADSQGTKSAASALGSAASSVNAAGAPDSICTTLLPSNEIYFGTYG